MAWLDLPPPESELLRPFPAGSYALNSGLRAAAERTLTV